MKEMITEKTTREIIRVVSDIASKREAYWVWKNIDDDKAREAMIGEDENWKKLDAILINLEKESW